MKGEIIRQALKDNDYVLDEVAKAMGISPQSLNNRLNSSDIKVGVLEEIAKAINKSIDFFFSERFSNQLNENSSNVVSADVVAEKVYDKLLPHISQILNKQILIEAALAKIILDKEESN